MELNPAVCRMSDNGKNRYLNPRSVPPLLISGSRQVVRSLKIEDSGGYRAPDAEHIAWRPIAANAQRYPVIKGQQLLLSFLYACAKVAHEE